MSAEQSPSRSNPGHLGISSPSPLARARPQLREEAATYIRELISSGQAAPGVLLRLGALADRLSASVTPVREALLLLARDGWVVQERNRGFRVAPIRRADIEDTYRVHSHVAGQLACAAVRNPTAGLAVKLRALDLELLSLDVEREPHHAEMLNFELHGVLYETAASPRLVWFIDAASSFVPRRFWSTIPGWPEHNRRGHTAIVDAVEAGDKDGAAGAMEDHIWEAGQLLLAHLDGIGYWLETPTTPQ